MNPPPDNLGLPTPIAVLGLGYVGLPLALAFGQHLPTVAFDVDQGRVRELQSGSDRNGDYAPEALRPPHLTYTSNPEDLAGARFHIVAVPTPVDGTRRPDTSFLVKASKIVGRALRSLDGNGPAYVVFESTVYPGCTEQVCLPILEAESGLRSGQDFHLGYSPERINTGDPEHTLDKVVKIVATRDPEALDTVAGMYRLVAHAGVYCAPDIPTAEAAKVIENVQRDLNIALMNELAMLFHRMGLDTHEVLRAARTKWNFLPFEPGFVGGHCIPVDPYYLTYRAQEVGYHPEVILAGRRINDQMNNYVAQQTVKLLVKSGKRVRGARVLVLGVTFKENVRDVRNSRAIDLVRELESYECAVFVHDPMLGTTTVEQLKLRPVDNPFTGNAVYDAIILAVPHKVFPQNGLDAYLDLLENSDGPGVIIDIKGALPKPIEPTQVLYWRL
ncbi:MAG: nucleotide sugar dehydrogenase [SAR202 cluster bacterium]|nr:nucleotide sugar dehydrogenase [SAR202 cluster bacterium]